MIQGEVFRMSSQEFMEIINIPRHTGPQDKIHLLPTMTDGELCASNHPAKALVFYCEDLVLYLAKDIVALWKCQRRIQHFTNSKACSFQAFPWHGV